MGRTGRSNYKSAVSWGVGGREGRTGRGTQYVSCVVGRWGRGKGRGHSRSVVAGACGGEGQGRPGPGSASERNATPRAVLLGRRRHHVNYPEWRLQSSVSVKDPRRPLGQTVSHYGSGRERWKGPRCARVRGRSTRDSYNECRH